MTLTLKYWYAALILSVLGISCAKRPSVKIDRNHEVKRVSSDPFSQFSRNLVSQTQECKWEFVGPDVHPSELNLGGRALPKYSENRGSGTGRINFLLPDPYRSNRIFACSPSGGLFVSNNQGENWKVAGTDKLPVSGVAGITVHPKDKNTWVIATGDPDDKFMYSDGLWRTNDGGRTYENINGSGGTEPSIHYLRQTFISKVSAHPEQWGRLFFAGSEGLYISENADSENPSEVCWKRISRSHFYDIEFHPNNPDLVFASGEKMMFSEDGGLSWQRIKVPILPDQLKYPFIRLSMEISPQYPDIVWIAYTRAAHFSQSAAGEAFLYKVHISSKKWEKVNSLRKGMNNMIVSRARAFTISPFEDSLIVCGNVQPVYRSLDLGRSFSPIVRRQMHDDIHHLEYSKKGDALWASHDGGVSKSLDNGITWEKADNGIGVANIFGMGIAQSIQEIVLYGGYDTGGNQLDSGKWEHVNFGDGFEVAVDPFNPNYRYVTRQNGYIHHSRDGGESYEFVASGGGSKSEWHSWFKLDPENPNMLYNSGKKVVRSSEYGDKQEVIFDVNDLNQKLLTVFKLFVSDHHPGVLYLYILDESLVNPIIVKTNNCRAKPEEIIWEQLPMSPREGWIMDLVVDESNSDNFYVVYNDTSPSMKVLYFNGASYEDHNGNLSYLAAESLVCDEVHDRLYLGTNHGVYTKLKDELNWTLLLGLPGTYIKTMAINKVTNVLYVGTYGRGVWKTDLLK